MILATSVFKKPLAKLFSLTNLQVVKIERFNSDPLQLKVIYVYQGHRECNICFSVYSFKNFPKLFRQIKLGN